MFAAALFIQPTQAPVSYYPTNIRHVPGAVPSRPTLVYPQDSSVLESDEAAATAEGDDWPTPDSAYFHAQNSILRWGLDGIPQPPKTAAPRSAEKPDMLLRSF
jgi:hypothetical protein